MNKIPGSEFNGNILILGAHSDDIEIGCLGFILKNKNAKYDFLVACGNDKREVEFLASVEVLREQHGVDIEIAKNFMFPDTSLIDFRGSLKDTIKNVTLNKNYNYIFTHYKQDLHQDHRVVAEITLEIFRKNQILSYDIPKYDGTDFKPSLYIRLDDEIINAKCKHLLACYKSETSKEWFNENIFRGLAALRGMESGSDWAEAFLPIKLFY